MPQLPETLPQCAEARDITGLYHADPIDELPVIPGYVITSELARGGMGRVLAGLELALHREVAIKTLLPGSDASRFVSEASITARLPHPSIPPIHALGRLSDGAPFLSMKLVRGRTLADELKDRPAPLADLARFLQIFEQIAQAVGFAHSQGIVHRDLKPANVMVGAFGEVQVMDWGLAKDLSAINDKDRSRQDADGMREKPAIDEQKNPASTVVTESTVFMPGNHEGASNSETADQQQDQTRAGTVLGTPSYMAPEQARGEPATFQSDVFSLGGILCCILTGRAVFGGSTVIETLQQASAGQTSEAMNRLQGCGADEEVIALAMRCLAIIPSERPVDGKDVAIQVANYRHSVERRLHEAETAKAEALVREAEQRKRRSVWLGLAASLMLGLVTSVILALWANQARGEAINARDAEARRAESERLAKEGEHQANLQTQRRLVQIERGNAILHTIFDDLDIREVRKTREPLEAILAKRLVKAGQQLEGESVGDALIVAVLQNRLGISLINLGYPNDAIPLFMKSHDTRKTQLGAAHHETLMSLGNLASGYQSAGKYELSIPLYEEALNLRRATQGNEHPDTIILIGNAALSYLEAGKHDKALQLQLEALRLRKARNGTDHPQTLVCMNNLADIHQSMGKLHLALPLYQETLSKMKTVMGDEHPDTQTCMNNLADCYRALGKLDEAIVLTEELFVRRKTVLGTDHPTTLSTMSNLASQLFHMGKRERAVSLLEETVKLRKERQGSDHPDTLNSMNNLAVVLNSMGKKEQALSLHEDIYKLKQFKLGADHPSTLLSMGNLADSYKVNGQLDRAQSLMEETFKLTQKKQGADHPDTLLSMNNLSSFYLKSGKLEKALALSVEALDLRKAKLGEDHPDTLMSLNNLAAVYRNMGKLEQALPLFRQAVAGAEKRHFRLNNANGWVINLIECHELLKQYDQAEQWRRKLLELVKEQSGADSMPYALELYLLGYFLQERQRWHEAENTFRQCLVIRQKFAGNSWGTFNTQAYLGYVLFRQQKYAEAEEHLLRGYAGLKKNEAKLSPAIKPRVAETLNVLIQYYTALHQPEKAKIWQAEKEKLSQSIEKK